MKRFLPFIFLLFTVFSIHAETVTQVVDWWVGKSIVDFKFDGLKNVSESQLYAFKSEYIGIEFSDDIYLEIYKALTSLDYFDRFEVYPIDPSNPEDIPDAGLKEEVILRFVVYENPVLDNIFLEGNKSIRTSDVLAELISVIGDPFKRSNLRVDRKAIKLIYGDKGYPDTQVKSRFELDEESGRAVIFFDIQEGIKRVVSTIGFTGNTVFKKLKLKTSIELREQSIAQDGLFDESILESDIEAIKALYFEKGYIRADVTEVKKIIRKNTELNQEELSLLFVIDEGVQYFFGGVDFFGNEIFSANALRVVVGLKPGDILNKIKLEMGLKRITDLYYADGYIYNEFSPFEMVSEDETIVSYRMTIAERPRAHIENITVKGNDKTEEFVIVRELPFREGDVFSSSRLRRGISNLEQLQIFESVDVQYEIGSVPGLMNLVIVVVEGRSTDVKFGVNFSQTIYDELPMQFFLEWSEKNLMGKGQHISVGTELNGSKQKFSFSFRESWLGDKRVSIGTSFGYEHNKRSMVYQDQDSPVGSGLPDPYEGNYYFTDEQTVNGKTYQPGELVDWGQISKEDIQDLNLVTDYDYLTYTMNEPISSDYLMTYTRHSLFAGVDAGYAWVTDYGMLRISSGITFGLEYNKFDDSVYRPLEPWLLEHNEEWVWNNRWTTSIVLDNRRGSATNPLNGYLFKQVFTYSGGILLGTTHYNKSRTTFEYYKTLFNVPVADKWSYKTVLAMHSSLHLYFDQFFVDKDVTGKLFTTVGTEQRQEDKLYTDRMNIMRGWDNELELEAIWENWIELRMPIYEQFVWADLFFEVTGIWKDLSDMTPTSSTDYFHEELADNFHFTIGGGFRLTMAQFPLAVYMTKGFQVGYNNHKPEIIWQKGQFGNKNNTSDGGVNLVLRLIYSY